MLTTQAGVYGVPAAVTAAATCFVIRMLGVHFGLNAPRPPGQQDDRSRTSDGP